MTPVFDADLWWERRNAQRTEERRKRLNAVCPYCGADLLDALDYMAHRSGDLPSTGAVRCGDCDTEVVFRLHWHIELWSAEVVP